MPVHKTALSFGRVTRMILMVFVVATVGAYWIGSESESRTVFWLCGLVGTGSLLGATLYALERVKQFHCPDCGELIPNHMPTTDKGGDPIEYLSETCDILWDTGLRSPRRTS